MKANLLDMLFVLFVVIPSGAALILVAGFYLSDAVRKTWRRK